MSNLITIEFDKQEIKLAKFGNLSTVNRFRELAMPILTANLRPLETFMAAVVNEFAPSQGWGMIEAVNQSEVEISRALLPAFRCMIDYYLKENTYKIDDYDRLMYDQDYLYICVMQQIKIESLLESLLARRSEFMTKVLMLTGLKLDTGRLGSRISELLQKADPDKEFTALAIK